MNELQGMELITGEFYHLVTNPKSGNRVVLISEVDRLPPNTTLVVLDKWIEGKRTLTVTFVKADQVRGE